MVLLYKKGATGLTGRQLAKGLGMAAVNDNHVERRQLKGAITDVLLRWGNDHEFPIMCQQEINSQAAVSLARNKPTALQVLSDEGVRVPRFVTEDKGPALGRTRYHQSGEGLRLFTQDEPLKGMDYYLELVPSKAEYRVHVVDRKVICTQRKVLSSTLLARPEAFPLRNYNNGWVFVRILERAWLSPIAIQAVQALGLDFGAVDILHTPDHLLYVLEVNTAPGLEGGSLERYVTALKELILKRKEL